MNDERFNHDLLQVLSEAAGEEAPMSLRSRLASITDEAPVSRRLWFSPPMRLSVAVVSVVAILALAFLLMPRDNIGPGPSASPTPSAGESNTHAPSTGPTATLAPTLPPTPGPSEWTGITWSDPVTPPFTVHVHDLVVLGDAYVAVGEVIDDGGQAEGAFLASRNGLDWTVTQRSAPGAAIPRYLAARGSDLYAFVRPDMGALPASAEYGHQVWHSTDGATWSLVDSPSWDAAWANRVLGPMPSSWDNTQWEIQSGLVDVAFGPGGLVAIGNSFSEAGMVPVILHSVDGRTWSPVSLPSDSPSPMLSRAAAHNAGFVVVGAVDAGPDETTAVPAAWFSADGVSWNRASVDESGWPTNGLRGEFGPVAAGADGIVACQGLRQITVGGSRYSTAWVSADGTYWQADSNARSPACGWMAGDGRRMVALAPVPHPSSGQQWPGVLDAFVSTDGLTWHRLTVAETLTDMMESLWIVPDGLIYSGVQSFWFGTPTTR